MADAATRGLDVAAADTPVQRRTLIAASVSTLLVLTTFVVPLGTGVRTAAELGAGPGGQAWLLSSMSVGLAAALLTAGVLADDLGRRRVFVAGLVLLGVGAAVAGLAGSPGMFIAGRIVQDVGGAAVLAAALGLIGSVYPPGPARSRATAMWGASIGAGTGIGGLLTVLLDHGTEWRVTYFVTAATAVLGAVVGRLVLPESEAPVHRRPDVVGAVFLAAGLSSLLAGLVQSRRGWSDPWVLALLAAGLVMLVAFTVVERTNPVPMLDLGLFANPGFTAATLGALVVGVAVVGLCSYLPTMIQRGLGESLLAATSLVMLWSFIGTATAIGVRWIPGLDGRVLLAGSLVVCAVGLGGLGVVGPQSSILRLLPGMIVLGVGYGAANAALGREAVTHVPPARAGMGSGANNTARYLGAAIGVTIVVLVVNAGGSADGSPAALTTGWTYAALATAAVSLLGGVAVALLRPRDAGRAGTR